MKPILFSIGPFNVYSFGVFLAIAFVLSTFLIWKFGRDELREEEYLDVYFYTSFAALLVSRASYILFHIQDFGINVLRYILVRDTPGLSLTGGMAGGFLFLFWYAGKKHYNVLHILDLFAVAASFTLAMAKIGQLLGGAGFGVETQLPIGVRIIGQSGKHHPVELYGAILLFCLSLLLYRLYTRSLRHKWPKGLTISVFAWSVSVIMFLLEFFTVRTIYLYQLSFNQVIALIGIGVFLYPVITRLGYLRKDHL